MLLKPRLSAGMEWLFSQAWPVILTSLLWIQVAYAISRDSLGFLRDKCEAKAGEAFEMESWAMESWELYHIKPLRVKVDTFCQWQFNIWLVFCYICWVTFFSMKSTDEEGSGVGRDFPGKGPRFRQILIFITESLRGYLTWQHKNVSIFFFLKTNIPKSVSH